MIQTTIRMPEKLYQKLKREAKERGVSLNSLMLTIFHESNKSEEEGEKSCQKNSKD